MKKKKLDAFIKSMPDDEMLYVGAKTSFIFIGTKDEWEKDKAHLNELHHDKIENCLSYSENNLNDNIVRLSKEYYNNEKEGLFNVIDELTYYLKVIRKCTSYLKDWKDIPERTVLDSYPRIQKDGTVIVFDGEETGSYWYKSEYDAKEGRNNPILRGYHRKENDSDV